VEKTSKIIKSNCQPNTTMPAKPCPEMKLSIALQLKMVGKLKPAHALCW